MWEKGGNCDEQGSAGREAVEQEKLIGEGDDLEEEVFEEEQNKTLSNNDTITNFETIFTVAENENFLRKRKNRNTIEMFDDMFDSLDITVIERVSDHVEDGKETNSTTNQESRIDILECVNLDSTAEVTLTDTSEETCVELPTTKIAPIAEQELSCNQCNRTFASENKLKNHMRKDHRAKSSSRFGCPECEWTGANAGVVKTHMKKKHK